MHSPDPASSSHSFAIVDWGRVDYLRTYRAMQDYTAQRTQPAPEDARDQLWLCEHPPVYTQGVAGRSQHLLCPGDIPVVQTDRGGQVTYHGPGQVVAYPLVDVRRIGCPVREYVTRLEEALLRTLSDFGVAGLRVAGAPGIYVEWPSPHPCPSPAEEGESAPSTRPVWTGLAKIGALGVKVSRHCAYHGIALNVAMDLEPFSRINPCGYAGLATVDLSTMHVFAAWRDVAEALSHHLVCVLQPGFLPPSSSPRAARISGSS
ncbi:lipoyl(octanoyl) transferase LipB [Candidatus Symbiobacter mobilis]|uniref:Octanoyltransferase n=1 Tax=Candidatus Symbiobacter mobilis CR TaxID=946483 RepID=U5NA73_9BURK|nr:lipoyl(octanoyl) transferase LipB [Candidatus Symbiobacter mobilis]AGX88441.1 lipoyl transferase [Candidatus Symbiobacter mobilis CR]